ncbi:HNH endonuclease signature motif containing protein [Streptomyces sp. NPDC020965]|uniref:HNH endonuclease signature motif containing protein n=1 Tax=Streptomyces sp. NPDC020965 TaxID=3365105 RepID=UPI00378F1556
MRPELTDRFLAKIVDGPLGCWDWTGHVKPNGDGQLKVNGHPQYAHRAAYTLTRGPIPEGLVIDHLCRRRLCANPDHLEVVSHRTNVLRGVSPAARRARQTHCVRGHRFDTSTTYIAPNGTRHCRRCTAARARTRRRRGGCTVPLPDSGVAWPPPPQLARHYAEIKVDDAWYSGDHDKLATVYRDNPVRHDGRRRLWGRDRQQHTGTREQRLHIPLPGDIAGASADLLFSEPPTLTATDTATQDRLDELAESDGIANTLLEAAEVAAALGSVYLRVTWDRSLADRPLLTSVHPDAAVPEFRWGHLSAVTFWHELPSTSAIVWRHLERHEPGRVLHGLYQGSADSLGVRVPLAEHTEVADLAASLGPDGDAIETGIEQLTAAYCPNIRPNRRNLGSVFGRSDYGTPIYDLFDVLDTTWTSWIRDLRLARARLLVPDGYLRDHGAGRGASFDEDREI